MGLAFKWESTLHAESSPLASLQSVDSGSDGGSPPCVSGPATPESGKQAWLNSGVVLDVAETSESLHGHWGSSVRFPRSQAGKILGCWFSKAVRA